MLDTGSQPLINSFKSASPKPSKIFVATLVVGVCVNDCLRLTNFHLLSDIAVTKKKRNKSIDTCIEGNF